jgi:hypothetical protein
MAASTKIAVWDIPPCSLVEVGRRLTGTYSLHQHGGDVVTVSGCHLLDSSGSGYQTSGSCL